MMMFSVLTPRRLVGSCQRYGETHTVFIISTSNFRAEEGDSKLLGEAIYRQVYTVSKPRTSFTLTAMKTKIPIYGVF